MFGARAHRPIPRPNGPLVARTAGNAWSSTWPFITTTLLALVMIMCIVIIGALEIASLAKSTNASFFGNTSATGAGFWRGLFFAIAAGLILMISCLRHTRLWATIALIATIIAACFAVILVALDAKGVSDGNIPNFGLYFDKSKIIAAQLAFAILEFILCLVFIGIYIAVLILAPFNLRRKQRRGFGHRNFV